MKQEHVWDLRWSVVCWIVEIVVIGRVVPSKKCTFESLALNDAYTASVQYTVLCTKE